MTQPCNPPTHVPNGTNTTTTSTTILPPGPCMFVIDIQGCTLMPMFFLLSGYGLAMSKGSTKYRIYTEPKVKGLVDFPYKQFYYQRFVRLLPLYWITALVALPLLYVGFGPFDPTDTKSLIASAFANVFCLTTIINGQWPPYPYGVSWDETHDPSNPIKFSPIYMKNINGPAWSICTIFWFNLIFPFIIKPMQRLDNLNLYKLIACCYWVQMVLLFGIYIGFQTWELNGGTQYFVEPGDVSFNFATLSPVTRLPIFMMGIAAGLIAKRTAKDPGFPWPGTLKHFLPPYSTKQIQESMEYASLPFQEQKHGKYGHFWWARKVDFVAFTLGLAFVAEILADTYYMNVMQYGSHRKNGLLGAVWFQAIVPFCYLTILVGLSRDGGKSKTSIFFNRYIFQQIQKWDTPVYLFHFPLIEFVTYAIGNPAFTDSFVARHSNWGSNDPMPWWAALGVFFVAIGLGFPGKMLDDCVVKMIDGCCGKYFMEEEKK